VEECAKTARFAYPVGAAAAAAIEAAAVRRR